MVLVTLVISIRPIVPALRLVLIGFTRATCVVKVLSMGAVWRILVLVFLITIERCLRCVFLMLLEIGVLMKV